MAGTDRSSFQNSLTKWFKIMHDIGPVGFDERISTGLKLNDDDVCLSGIKY